MSQATKSQIWRYRCPEGHTNWRSRKSWQKQAKSKYYCATCKDNGDDPHFDELVDAKEL